jgi:excinuclease UvrABC ATPase subunit
MLDRRPRPARGHPLQRDRPGRARPGRRPPGAARRPAPPGLRPRRRRRRGQATSATRSSLAADKRHTIEVYVDRLVLKDGIRGRLADSFEVALRLTGGLVLVLTLDGQELLFSEQLRRPRATASPTRRSPRACSPSTAPTAPAPSATASARAASSTRAAWSRTSTSASRRAPSTLDPPRRPRPLQALQALAAHYKFDLFAPWARSPTSIKVVLLHGSGDERSLASARSPPPSRA